MTIHLPTSSLRIIGAVAGAWIGLQVMVLLPIAYSAALVPLLALAGLTGPVARHLGAVLAAVGSLMVAELVMSILSAFVAPAVILPLAGVAAAALTVVLGRSIRVVRLAAVRV